MLDGACVFLRDDRLCALHVAGGKELGTPFKLKPAICPLWPLCVVDGDLDVGYASFTRRKECCAPVRAARPENTRAGAATTTPRGAR